MAVNPEPPATGPSRRPCRSLWHLAWRGGCHGTRWVLRCVALLAIILMLVLSYLNFVGFPALVIDHWVDWMREQGYHITLQKLTLDLLNGLTAHEVRLYTTATAADPLLEAENLSVFVNPVYLLLRKPAPLSVMVENGAVRLNIGRYWIGARQGSRMVKLERVQTRFAVAQEGLVLREFYGELLGIQWRGRGVVQSGPGRPRRETPVEPFSLLQVFLDSQPAWVIQLVEQLNAIDFETPPAASFAFSVPPTNRADSQITLHVDGRGGQIRGLHFDDWAFEVRWAGNRLSVPTLMFEQDPAEVRLSGEWDVDAKTAEAHFFSTLPPREWIRVAPEHFRTNLLVSGMDWSFPLTCEAHIGPAPLTQLVHRISGMLDVEQTDLKGVWVERARLAFDKGAQVLAVSNLDLVIGQKELRSRIQGDGEYTFSNRNFFAALDGRLNPYVLLPVVDTNSVNIINWFGITNPPVAQLEIGGIAGYPPSFFAIGKVGASNFTMQGAYVQDFSADLILTNSVMLFDHARVTRPEGVTTGWVAQHFNSSLVEFDLEGAINPLAIAQMLGSNVLNTVDLFTFNGPTRLYANGVVDYDGFEANRGHVRIEAHDMAWARCRADTARFDVNVAGQQIVFTNIVAALYDGAMNGHVQLYPVGSPTNWRYDITAQLRGVNFTNLLAAFSTNEIADLRGALQADCRVAGFIGTGRCSTVEGGGNLQITEARLFQWRLLRGLTEILSKIYVDFPIFAQTEFKADFAFTNCQVVTENAMLEGSLISIKARGAYYFNSELDFKVEAQLLRSGPLAALLRLATMPLTRLLEFRLIGTTQEPRWRPVNLPKELFFITN